MNRLTRDGRPNPSRGTKFSGANNEDREIMSIFPVHFPCSADHEQDWQPYLVDPYSAICDDHTYILVHYYGSDYQKKNLNASNKPSEQSSKRLILKVYLHNNRYAGKL